MNLKKASSTGVPPVDPGENEFAEFRPLVDPEGRQIVSMIGSPEGSPNLGTGQVTITTSATLIAAARTNRRAIVIKLPTTGTGPVFIGLVGVTTVTGFHLEAGDSITLDYRGAIYGRLGSGTDVVSYLEEWEDA